MRLGGLEVALFFREFDLSALLDRGEDWTTGTSQRPMRPSNCHGNVVRLWSGSRGGTRIATGYALSDDGLWRQHSWGVREGRIIETTCPRVRYYGFELTNLEALRFAVANAGPRIPGLFLRYLIGDPS